MQLASEIVHLEVGIAKMLHCGFAKTTYEEVVGTVGVGCIRGFALAIKLGKLYLSTIGKHTLDACQEQVGTERLGDVAIGTMLVSLYALRLGKTQDRSL